MSVRTVLHVSVIAVAVAAAPVLADDNGDHHGDAEHADDVGHEGGMHAAHWMAPNEAQDRQNPFPATADGLADAADTYAEFCALCHGPEGKGDGEAAEGLDPKPTDLRQMVPIHTDGDLAWKIEHGRGTMPAWGEILDERQIWQLVTYLRQEIAAGAAGAGDEHQDH